MSEKLFVTQLFKKVKLFKKSKDEEGFGFFP